jgi:hypothetical protein
MQIRFLLEIQMKKDHFGDRDAGGFGNIGNNVMDWISPVQSTDRWRALVEIVIRLQF